MKLYRTKTWRAQLQIIMHSIAHCLGCSAWYDYEAQMYFTLVEE